MLAVDTPARALLGDDGAFQIRGILFNDTALSIFAEHACCRQIGGAFLSDAGDAAVVFKGIVGGFVGQIK